MVRSAVSALSGALGSLRGHLAARPDTEHEQAIIRMVIASVLVIYLLSDLQQLAVWSAYFIASVAILAGMLVQPRASPARRVLGALADTAMLTWVLIQYGEHAAPLFLLYLWITLANGFRFGPEYLMVSLVFSVAGFGAAILRGDFWINNNSVSLGMMLGLILVSLYVKKLVTQQFATLARAAAANEAKRRFISVVSHEMRTPLNAIIGMADLLRDTTLSREQADMLQTLRSSSRLMLGLVDDVLDFSKIEAGKVTLERVEFDLHALVNSTCRILAVQAAAKNVDFVVSIMPEVPPIVRGDPHYLRQVLINLGGNATKFTERGSVTVHVSSQGESESVVQLKVSIRDTGIGIPPEAQARIFESFTQADESTSRRFGGTGLGTTIAKQLVGLMGGRIGLESAVGLGSTFWFEVGLEKPAERGGAPSGEFAGARVLLVAFPAPERQALEQALSSWGATAIAVGDADEALARLVTDISLAQPYHSVMLSASGMQMKEAQQFRRALPNPPPPVVLAVAHDAGQARFEALSGGFAAVLELPFEKRHLFNVLHSVTAGDEVTDGVVRLQDYARRLGAPGRLRVLVADDNPTNREVVGKILQRGGHVVTLVNDGAQALDALEAAEFDVALFDRNMPGMGGIEALQALRFLDRGRARLPVAILSADATPEAKREALESGADAFLSKPVEAARLLEQIQSLARKPAEAPRETRAEFSPAARLAPADTIGIIDEETLRQLESLGSSAGFVEKLVGIFLVDNAMLVSRIEQALAARDYREFRAHLHALKGSSASMGTHRLTRACTTFGSLSDAEIRLQAPALLRSLSEEFSAVRGELELYLVRRRQSAG